ncbi:phosphatidylinositol-specific phospholipase C domain-containing protein [Streptomyces sp. NPDC089919]|uniref:phosphatidylinositol-specific phospholipase C domain-containing protein n=1 Tax=Streptomyces sp. NPDC089919 TaxID=3155188 RepID=UPI00344071D0
MPRPGAFHRSRLLRLLVLPVLPLLVLASALTAPTGAVAADSKYGYSRYDQWSWLTTHNSYASGNAGSPMNPDQSETIKQQLEGGVRALMLDTYDPNGNGPVEMCHGSNLFCYDDFKVALLTIVNFLKKNPQEVVTVFLENYASQETLTRDITNMLNASGGSKYLFNQNKYGIFSNNWPRLRDMVADDQRLVIFQDSWDDTALGSGTLMNTWTHTVENKYGYGIKGTPNGCAVRDHSQPLNTKTMPGTKGLTPLFTMNQFNSDEIDPAPSAPRDNGSALKKRIETCKDVAERVPNFVAVNFYQVSDRSGITPMSAVDDLNIAGYVYPPDPAVWVVNGKQYRSTVGSNRCMVRGDEFSDGSGGLVTQRACADPVPSSHQWTATKPDYDGKGYYWIKAGNGTCLTVPYNNGTPPGNGTQLFWWPCETKNFSGSQLWNVMPNDAGRSYYFVNQWTGKCLALDPATATAKAGKVVQAACPSR